MRLLQDVVPFSPMPPPIAPSSPRVATAWLAVLLLTPALSGCASPDASFPHAFLLGPDEVPAGLSLSQDGNGTYAYPIGCQPGTRPCGLLGGSPAEIRFEEFSSNAGLVVVIAGRYNDTETAGHALIGAKQRFVAADPCPAAALYTTVLLADNVLVLVAESAPALRSASQQVVSSLKEHNPQLEERGSGCLQSVWRNP